MAKYLAEPLPTAMVNDLAWLAGTWVGERRGESIEEHWSEPAADGIMMGMFRWLRQEKGVLYEFMTLEPGDNGGVVLRIKHFNASLFGWEEKDQSTVFTLVAQESGNYIFRHPKKDSTLLYLVYQPIEEGGLLVYFDSDDEAPDPESGFRYVRQPL